MNTKARRALKRKVGNAMLRQFEYGEDAVLKGDDDAAGKAGREASRLEMWLEEFIDVLLGEKKWEGGDQ